jgi:iron complex transport system substrate-binding protein
MTGIDWANAAALAAALSAAALVVLCGGGAPPPAGAAAPAERAGVAVVTLPDGRPAAIDARGSAVALIGYQRVISLALVSDQLLLELCQPERVIAVSAFGSGASAFRMGTRPRLPGLDDLERVIALHGDLVLLSSSGGDAVRIERLRAAGVAVFDLGDQAGLDSLCTDALAIGALLGTRERAERLVATLRRRMAGVAARLPAGAARRRALVVQAMGGKLFGGTVGSSYHDVLAAAGLIDVAAARYHGWPQYRSEELIALAPDLIVTTPGGGEALRRLPGLSMMAALRQPGGVIELPGDLLEDSGLGMLACAEALFEASYPALGARTR